jgi:transposase
MLMTKDQCEIQRKLRILRYAEEIGHVAKACRYLGIGRPSFYRWRQAYAERGEAGLVNAPPIPKWHANRTSPEREDTLLYLRSKYHLGPMRIVWYLERYHDIKMSDATVSRILRPWHEPPSTWHPYAQSSYQALSETGAGASHPDGR